MMVTVPMFTSTVAVSLEPLVNYTKGMHMPIVASNVTLDDDHEAVTVQSE